MFHTNTLAGAAPTASPPITSQPATMPSSPIAALQTVQNSANSPALQTVTEGHGVGSMASSEVSGGCDAVFNADMQAYAASQNTPENLALWTGTAIASLRDPDFLAVIGAGECVRNEDIGAKWATWLEKSRSPFGGVLQKEFYRAGRIRLELDPDDGSNGGAIPIFLPLIKAAQPQS